MPASSFSELKSLDSIGLASWGRATKRYSFLFFVTIRLTQQADHEIVGLVCGRGTNVVCG